MKTHRTRWVVWLLLIVLYAQLANAAVQLSATVDEAFHITSGYEYLRTGTLRLFDEHVPVAKALFAWPLFFVPDLSPPENAADYATGNLITVTKATTLAYRPLDRVIVAPRLAAILLAWLLAATVYRCATAWAGPWAGLLALVLCVFDPNFLAHGSLATTDMGATAFIFWAIWAGNRWLRNPTPRCWWSAALLLGLAQGAKLTALLLYPVLGLGVFLEAGRQKHSSAKYLLKMVTAYAGIAVVSLLLLWALYGFEMRPLAGILGGTIPLPAASHIERWQRLQDNLTDGREAFLLGQNAMHGWPQYFPVAFLLKTPLPLLLLLGALLFRGAYRILHCKASISHRTHPLPWIAFYAFPLLYALASLTSPFNIGYRHLLPLLPFLYVGIGAQMANGEWRIANGESRIAHHASRLTLYFLPLASCLLLLTWHIIGTLAIAPHYLTFFNEIGGGPKEGWRYLADSNTDWGQGYRAVARFQEMEGIDRLHLAAFAFYDPTVYGVNYTPLTPLGGDTPAVFPSRFAPPPGDYVISTSPLNGIPLADPEMYDWFRWRAPDAQIANALHYYHVTADEVAVEWIAQCNVPVAPLDDTAIAEGFGRTGVRRVDFDCTQSWLIPGGDAPGRYVLHGAQLQDTLRARLHLTAPPAVDPFVARRLDALDIVYRQRAYRTEPAFAIYAPAGERPIPASGGWIARAETPPAALQEQTPIAGPVEMDGPLTFLGAAAYRQKDSLDVETWWLVSAAAPARPLSIMGHLLATSGEVKGVADGLGIPIYAWQTGDILIQRHTFALSAAEARADYVLRTGVYWLDDGTRWSIKTTTEADAFFIPFTLQ